MIVNVFDERAPGKHENAPLEKGKNAVLVKITKEMTMEQVVSQIKKEVTAAGGEPGSISLLRFFGHGNAGTMDFGKAFQSWTVKPLKDLANWMDPEGKGLELHGCYTGSAVYVRGQDCSKPGRFYPREHRPGVVGIGYELLLELSFVLNSPVTAGINCQYGDPAYKLEGPTITVSPDGYTLRNVPLDLYDDRGKSKEGAPEHSESESQKDSHTDFQDRQDSVIPALSERIKLLPDSDELPHTDFQDRQDSVIPDLSERIKLLPDSDELPHTDFQDRQDSVIPDLSERIKLLPDSDELPHTDFQDRQDSVIPDLSERIKLLPDSDELPHTDFQDRQDSVIPDLSERIKLLPDSDELPNVDWDDRLIDFPGLEEHEPFEPFPDQIPLDRFGADRLIDFPGLEEHEPFEPFPDQVPLDRFGADRLIDFPGLEEHEPFEPFPDQIPLDRFGADRLTDFGHESFKPFQNQNPMDRFGADRLTDFGHESFKPFQNQNPLDRFGADRLTDFGHEPFQPFSGPPQWMKQGFSEPPQFGSLIDNRHQQHSIEKPKWKK